ncbi:hypothetical protein JZM24_04190 [Candidatus Sodalis endolongispinus]|uniref:Uncharacterized protein n=1 Tax=Candidatus Sodalis endolongispinus TaxID=2812662 RepID=A0ABS5Y980_9GAMM|nr:hypothetical protein [Candidatus Sodalis endolongispinus]MBT9431551.1 hypothetical protein [Candidatus Sodalis endolongispinus]
MEDCHLTSLPTLIAPLGTLISRGNPLGRFDAPLPTTLQEFDAEGIEYLPKTFYAEFRTLKVVSSTSLKEDDLDHLVARAKNLDSLTVIVCDRKRLPYDLPTTIKFLHFADNSHLTDDAMDDLADKLPKLEKLVIEGNALKRLPRNLPPSLKELIVKNNQIEELPDNIIERFPKLTLLDMENNKLEKPPMAGAPLSGLPRVKIKGNPIPNNTPRDANRIAELEKELAHMKNLFTKLLTDKREDEKSFTHN